MDVGRENGDREGKVGEEEREMEIGGGERVG